MKKIFLAFVLLGILTAGFALATPLENTYPAIGNSVAPTSARADVPTFIKYIFNFALVGAALAAFGALVYGGIKYISSSGNASKTGDAKEMIFSAFLGLGVLLFSWIFLDTINPQLTKIELPSLQFAGGVKVTFDDGSIIVYSSSVGNIDKNVAEIDFATGDYDVTSYSSSYWGGAEQAISPGSVSNTIKSLKIVSKIPGVYLCYTESSQEICQNFTYSSPSFADLKGKFTKLKILDEANFSGHITKRYVAILFEKENYGFGGIEIYENKGAPPQIAGPILPGTKPQTYATLPLSIASGWVSSIKVFYYDSNKPHPGKVSFWNSTELQGSANQNIGEAISSNNLEDGVKNETRSVEVQGQRLVILCENPCDPINVTIIDGFKCSQNNRCQSFSATDSDLTNDSIGTCRIEVVPNWSFSWLKKYPCADYFIVKTYEKQ